MKLPAINCRSHSHPVAHYALRRLFSLLPVLLGVTLLTYGLLYLSPQDPVEMLLQGQGTAPNPDVAEAMRSRLGLDRPFLVQYGSWLWNCIRGDMGVSYIDGAPVAGKLLTALPNTLKLTPHRSSSPFCCPFRWESLRL